MFVKYFILYLQKEDTTAGSTWGNTGMPFPHSYVFNRIQYRMSNF